MNLSKTIEGNLAPRKSVEQEWLENSSIFVLTLLDSTRQGIDDYHAAIETVRQPWNKNCPFFAIYDVSHPDVAVTPYAREKMNSLARNAPSGLYGAYAIIIKSPIVKTLAMLYLRVARRKDSKFTHAFFTNKQAAINWLLEKKAGYDKK